MLRLHAGFNSFALPAVLAAVGVSTAGAALPSNPETQVRVGLSASAVDYGQKVVAHGRAPATSSGTVRIFTVNAAGRSALTARAVISRGHSWKAAFRAVEPGRIVAMAPVGLATPEIASISKPVLRIHQTLLLAQRGGIVTSGPVRVSGAVQPAGRRAVKITGHGGFRKVVHTAANGRFHFSSPAATAASGLKARALQSQSFLPSKVRTLRVHRYRAALASFYDDYGLPVACGGVLGRGQIGVAHKTLPCGTKLQIRYRGRSITARVIDRGPYIAGREFDLTGAAARALHFDGVATIWVSR